MAMQQTLKDKVTLTGIGVHSGRETTVTLRPAEAGTGIVFHRIDLSPAVSIEAIATNVVNTRLCTTIGRNGAVVSTVEHLMAALASCGVDNAHVDIDGAEVPIMDGSAAPFVAAIRRAGAKKLSRPRKYLVVKKPVSVADGDKKVTIMPSRRFKVSFDMRFNHPAVASQHLTMRFDGEEFAAAFASARTFGFLAEVEMLKANGLARGGSLENAVVIGDQGVLNPEGLRFEDEFVRHKILDTVGDLAMIGCPILGHVKATRSGHDMNHRFVTELLTRTDCWKLVEAGERNDEGAALSLPLPELAWSKG
ncbi:UDP-3-O-acyl-N-acetylglucosamine deacetylase [Geobacter hydrogenophilus]|uniref:UDP-3-O-acyl-N-acetylglucosamine deacetylase n=1 Tax=Geobacter hydrogenophilus TaxID=40983 RepID=A0A9W6G4B3_9BACT|nr:UDP-3-O-acyl-N-acetylglucosamine deacetylase [Geobacter hydrogenophilus]MBT0892733.1 UDP-3-O-acyl-N-acetylglucosamine deacetylase [Geobacter hydrogenophilus]GLI40132.1 UDP-3-O-acyl-N-acetylglucosamine deacetylase [Geobacter hydrogenophilus]